MLTSEALLHTKKNPSHKMLLPVGIDPGPSDSKSNTLLSELILHVLLRGSLNFYSCTTWFLDLDDLVRILKWGRGRGHFITGIFCFHVVKSLTQILALLPISSSLWKTLFVGHILNKNVLHRKLSKNLREHVQRSKANAKTKISFIHRLFNEQWSTLHLQVMN